MATTQEIIPNGGAELLTSAGLSELDLSTPDAIETYLNGLGLTEAELDYKGSDFELTDKAELVDVPLFLIQWRFKASAEFGGEYAIIHAVRADTNEKIVFVDGGTGVRDQLDTVTSRRLAAGLVSSQQGLAVRKGLVRSDYAAREINGEVIPAGTTYYLG